MGEGRHDGEREPIALPGPLGDPQPDGTGGGRRTRLWVALALTLVAAVVLTGVAWSGLLAGRAEPSGSVLPSAAVVVPSAASAVPSVTPLPSVAEAPTVSPRPPTAPTSPGLIAVVGEDGVLSTMDDGGGSLVSYLAPGAVLGFPAWSPDGTQIAAIGQGGNDTAIYVFDVPAAGASTPGATGTAGPTIGPDPVVIYRSPDRAPFYLYWTPDGRQVGFLATEGAELSLRIAPADGSAPLDGSGPAALIRQGAPLYFDWIEADRLLVHVNVGSEAYTGEVGLDGAPVDAALEGSGLFRSASVSGDGRYLAYVRSESDGSEQLVVASRDGSANHEMAVFGPVAFAFDPSGDAVASVAADEPVAPDAAIPFGPLRLTDPRTGEIRTLLDGPVVAFFWSPDGQTIAAILPSRPGDAPVTIGAGSVAQAAGVTARLVFVDVATGVARPEQVVGLAPSFVNQLLPYFDQYALSHRLWSPDSASILLPLVDATGGTQLVTMSTEGADPRPVAAGASGFWSP